MRRSLLVLSVVLTLVVAFTLPNVVAQGGKERSDRMKQRWDQLSEAKRERAMEKGEKAKMFSKCRHDNGTVGSRFVRFHYAKDTGVVSDLTLKTDRNETGVFFTEIEPSPFNATRQPFVTGAVFHHQADNLTIRGHCNPTAVFGWSNDNGTRVITFTVPDNASASQVNTREARVNVSAAHGHVMASGNGTVVVVGQEITVTLGPKDKAMFRAHPAMGQAKTLHEQNAAFQRGKLGAVVNLVGVDGTPVSDSEDVDVETDAQELSRGKLKLIARASVSGNRVLYITVDGESFDVQRITTIRVTVSGQAATNATAADAVVNATAAASFVTDVDGAVQVVVNVPHFSDQTIEVTQAGTGTGDGTGDGDGDGERGTPGPAFVVALLAVVAAVVAAAARRR